MSYFFTSESVSEGHPDKVADAVSDALIDHFLAFDPQSKVACETLVTTGQVVLAGEVKSEAYLDVQKIARDTIARIGYTKSEYQFDAASCGVLSAIHEQSSDINQGVERQAPEDQGAGDQGMMFGYACSETDNHMPLALELSHRLLRELADIRKKGQEMTYLRPDSKSQVTIEYHDDGTPLRIEAIVLSTQHDEFGDSDSCHAGSNRKGRRRGVDSACEGVDERARSGVVQRRPQASCEPHREVCDRRPHGDTGLTGRKIIVDTYGGKGAHGGGAFSGKDPSKVDRSAAYATRHIAKNLVAAGVTDEALVQVAYAIGVADPVGLFVNTYGKSNVSMTDGEIAQKLLEIFPMRPFDIETRFQLRSPIYSETAAYGHMGRKPQRVTKTFVTHERGEEKTVEVELFPWEKLDKVEEVKAAFGL